MDPSPTPARRLWAALEPIHATVYFAPEPAEAARRVGLRGWWMGYFAGRLAPLGPIRPEPAAAMMFGFAPTMVARALPDAWSFAGPGDVLATRVEAVTAALRRTLPPGTDAAVDELVERLAPAAGSCRPDGRPLAAGWAAVPAPDDRLARLWLLTTVLREHRGDGHVAAAVASGLGGLDTTLTLIATGAVTRALMQPARGWTDDDWDGSRRRLEDRGLIDRAGRLTEAGAGLRQGLEETTDRLAAAAVEALGQPGLERVIDLATPISRHLVDRGVVPVPNPVGVPRP